MGGLTFSGWLWVLGTLVAPPLLLSALLQKLRKNRLWSLLWFVFLGAFYIWFVWSYDR